MVGYEENIQLTEVKLNLKCCFVVIGEASMETYGDGGHTLHLFCWGLLSIQAIQLLSGGMMGMQGKNVK